MKSYVYYHMKYVLYGMAVQALVTASLSFIGQIVIRSIDRTDVFA